MIHHRKAEEVRRFDMFKLIITILLSALLFGMVVLNICQAKSSATNPPLEAGITADAAPEVGITPDSAPQAIELTLNEPANGKALPTGELTLTGTGTAGEEVQIVVVATAEVASDGTWELTTALDDADSPIGDAKAPTGDGNAPTVSLPPSGSSSAGEITLRGYRETPSSRL